MALPSLHATGKCLMPTGERENYRFPLTLLLLNSGLNPLQWDRPSRRSKEEASLLVY